MPTMESSNAGSIFCLAQHDGEVGCLVALEGLAGDEALEIDVDEVAVAAARSTRLYLARWRRTVSSVASDVLVLHFGQPDA
jgi:hypothetical protein